MATAFHAYLSESVLDVTGNGSSYTIVWDSTRFDVDGELNTTTGIFTATTPGIYRFSTSVRISGIEYSHNSYSINIHAGGTNYNIVMVNPYDTGEKASGNNAVNLSGSLLVSLQENDEVYTYITVTNGSQVIDVVGLNYSNFCGELVQ